MCICYDARFMWLPRRVRCPTIERVWHFVCECRRCRTDERQSFFAVHWDACFDAGGRLRPLPLREPHTAGAAAAEPLSLTGETVLVAHAAPWCVSGSAQGRRWGAGAGAASGRDDDVCSVVELYERLADSALAITDWRTHTAREAVLLQALQSGAHSEGEGDDEGEGLDVALLVRPRFGIYFLCTS